MAKWKMVPEEPEDIQVKAGAKACTFLTHEGAIAVYRAMVRAAREGAAICERCHIDLASSDDCGSLEYGCLGSEILNSSLPSLAGSEDADRLLEARIAVVVEQEGLDGAACGWRPCTGCHETNEGASTGFYPRSKLFGCEIGSGCRECGGLGVVWEHYPASALASMGEEAHADLCPICAKPFKPDDICATDISEGICHAACLEGAPVVDLETGDETGGKADTYRYGDDAAAENGG